LAKLKAAARKRSATVRVKGKAKFPIPTKAHARVALARLNQAKGLSASQKRKVVSRAYKKLGVPPSKRRVKVTASGRISKKKRK
jgi:hypothetical protein